MIKGVVKNGIEKAALDAFQKLSVSLRLGECDVSSKNSCRWPILGVHACQFALGNRICIQGSSDQVW
jgi:hypothetical protein